MVVITTNVASKGSWKLALDSVEWRFILN